MDLTDESVEVVWSDRPRIGVVAATVGVGALFCYLFFVFVYKETIIGWNVGAGPTALALTTGAICWFWALKRLLGRRPSFISRAVNVGLVCGVATTTIVMTDLSYGLYANWVIIRQSATMDALDFSERHYDARIWHGELAPPIYYPTSRNFRLYKPNTHVTGETHGAFYHPDMLASRRLTDSVLELRSLSYDIGPLGFRESASLAESRTFALGDSFVFGYGTDEGEVWTDLLSQALDEPVYNLGVSNTGPRQQLLLLEYLLETHKDSIRVERLLWMIFEGNDLEDGYADQRPLISRTSDIDGLAAGTVLGSLFALPGNIKNSSILRRVLRGELGRAPGGGSPRYDAYEVDGVRLPFPLYRSEHWGYQLFSFQEIDLVGRPREYVLEHPNRSKLEETFKDMESLSRVYGFKVTVIVAPTAARLHGPSLDGFPPVSREPHFIQFVTKLAQKAGFEVVDLLAGMQPYANEQLLYLRDDHHWNSRGNTLAARIIERAITR